MYTGKKIPVTVRLIQFHTGFKYVKNAPENNYQSKYEQNCVFGSMESSFVAIRDSVAEDKNIFYVWGCGRKPS